MANKSFLETFVESPANMRRYQQERAIAEATGLICKTLEERKISRADLAALLDKTKSWVTQLLDCERNTSVRTLADVFAVLGLEMHFSVEPIEIAKPVIKMEFAPPANWNQQRWSPNAFVRSA